MAMSLSWLWACYGFEPVQGCQDICEPSRALWHYKPKPCFSLKFQAMVHVQVQLWHRKDCKVDAGYAKIFLPTAQISVKARNGISSYVKRRCNSQQSLCLPLTQLENLRLHFFFVFNWAFSFFLFAM